MPSSESNTNMESGDGRKQLKSVVQTIGCDTPDDFVDTSRLSDGNSVNNKENSERDWRKPKNTARKDNYSYNDKNALKRGEASEDEHHRKRYKKAHYSGSDGYNQKTYKDLDKPESDSDEPRHEKSRRKDHDSRAEEDKYFKEKRRKGRHEEKNDTENDDKDKQNENLIEPVVERKKKTIEDIFTKAGGAYIPPSKLRQLQEGITDKTSVAYQRMSWEALKKSINGLVNKVNVSNIGHIVEELLQENIVRGRGLLSQSIMRAQVASPTFSAVYAALVAIINTKFPKVGELILRRLVIQFRRSFKRNDKPVCINSAKFIAHLVNQNVAHEILCLEILTLLLQNPTSDSAEVAISFLKELGQKLTDVSPRGINAVFERIRNILHDSETEKRVQYMVEVMFAIRKDGFKDYPSIPEGLDLVEEDDQITHLLRLDDEASGEDILNVFKVDPDYVENEEKYKEIKKNILGESDGEDSSGDDEDDDDDDDDEEEIDNQNNEGSSMDIIDKTETNLVALRRLIYLTIQSSLDFEECAHKMMKLNIKPGQEHEFCFMVVECCAQQRSYEKFFGLLGQRFCMLKKEFMEQYVIIFQEQYDSCHHLETNKLRNTGKFFAHLLHSDAIPWTVMECICLNEDDTTSSSRIFIKILFQELAQYLGIEKFNNRLKDLIIAPYLEGIFPRDNPKNTRFSINFFTAIGLGGVTDGLREHLKNAPKVNLFKQQAVAALAESSSSSSSSDDDSSSSSDSSDSSSDTDSESEGDKRKKTTRKQSETSDKRSSRSIEGRLPKENSLDKNEHPKKNRHEKRRNYGENESRRNDSSDETENLKRDRNNKRNSHTEGNRGRRNDSPDETERFRLDRDDKRNRYQETRSHRNDSPDETRDFRRDRSDTIDTHTEDRFQEHGSRRNDSPDEAEDFRRDRNDKRDTHMEDRYQGHRSRRNDSPDETEDFRRDKWDSRMGDHHDEHSGRRNSSQNVSEHSRRNKSNDKNKRHLDDSEDEEESGTRRREKRTDSRNRR